MSFHGHSKSQGLDVLNVIRLAKEPSLSGRLNCPEDSASWIDADEMA
jgi:hypothetical protein